jgi:hypothetical protein
VEYPFDSSSRQKFGAAPERSRLPEKVYSRIIAYRKVEIACQRKLTRPVSSAIMEKPENPIPDLQATVREQILPAVSELKDIQERLRAFQESLPDTPDQGEEEMDAVTELRSILGCVLLDSLGPAIRDLLAAVAYVAKSGEPDAR